MYPAPSQQRRAPAALQPYYYHSSVFIDPTREDISRMLSSFEDSCTAQTISRPFALFKSIWAQHGWDLIHLKVLDGRGREAFLDVMCRLFLGAYSNDHAPTLLSLIDLRVHSPRPNPFAQSGRPFRSLHFLHHPAEVQLRAVHPRACSHCVRSVLDDYACSPTT